VASIFSKGFKVELVTVVNRTSKDVKGTWDGKPYVIKPKARVALPLIVAEAIKRQNVVMGSEDPYTGEMQYLVGIEEAGDPIDATEQTQVVTRMNRAPLGKNEEVVKGHNGLYSVRDLGSPPNEIGNTATSFANPNK